MICRLDDLLRTHRFVFSAVGKTGTTSIEEVLRPYAEPLPLEIEAGPDEQVKHIPPRLVLPRPEAAQGKRCETKIDGTTILKTNNKHDLENPGRTALNDEVVVARYKELARVERASRDLKSFIDLRPMYHRVATRIASRVFFRVLPLLFERIVERKLRAADVSDLWGEVSLRSLKRIRLLRDSANGIEVERVSHIGADQRRVLRALEVAPPSRLVSVRPKKASKRRKPR